MTEQERIELERQLAAEREARTKAEARLMRVTDCLNWLVHLHHGVGMAGHAPEEYEWEYCLEQCESVLNEEG